MLQAHRRSNLLVGVLSFQQFLAHLILQVALIWICVLDLVEILD